MIELSNISLAFGQISVFSSFSLSLKEGSSNVLLGPSGCGKTSLLRLLAGSVTPDSGKVLLSPNTVVAYAFQESRLFPWLSVVDNVGLACGEKIKRKDRRQRALSLLRQLGLEDFAQSKPSELSGGMKQRVALARTFAQPASLILLDEPFQGLDLGLKLSIMDLCAKLWQERGGTLVFVTHDIHESLYLGQELFLLSPRPTNCVERLSLDGKPTNRDLAEPRYQQAEAMLLRRLSGFGRDSKNLGSI